MACKECIHDGVCHIQEMLTGLELEEYIREFGCEDFKNKADFAEVKHSRWENISGFDVCNICGTSPAYCEPKPNNPKGYPPYCHNCGAKMDGRSDS